MYYKNVWVICSLIYIYIFLMSEAMLYIWISPFRKWQTSSESMLESKSDYFHRPRGWWFLFSGCCISALETRGGTIKMYESYLLIDTFFRCRRQSYIFGLVLLGKDRLQVNQYFEQNAMIFTTHSRRVSLYEYRTFLHWKIKLISEQRYDDFHYLWPSWFGFCSRVTFRTGNTRWCIIKMCHEYSDCRCRESLHFCSRH
jgi:hypothetical protein